MTCLRINLRTVSVNRAPGILGHLVCLFTVLLQMLQKRIFKETGTHVFISQIPSPSPNHSIKALKETQPKPVKNHSRASNYCQTPNRRGFAAPVSASGCQISQEEQAACKKPA